MRAAMAQRITKLQRWLDLIAFLVGRRFPVSLDEIMEGVPAYAERWRTGEPRACAGVRRMFERDKDELRAAGIPLDTVPHPTALAADSPEPVEGYQLAARDFYLPYVRLVERSAGGGGARRGGGRQQAGRAQRGGALGIEAVELTPRQLELALEALERVGTLPASPLAAAARSAVRKLTFDVQPDALALAPVIYAVPPHAHDIAPVVRTLSRALLARKRVRFRYHGIRREEPTTRDVAPYGLLFRQGHWYLIGRDASRDAVRVFRADRMEDVKANTRAPHTRDYAVPPDFRLARFTRREAWDLSDDAPIRAHVLFQFPASLWAERNRKGELLEQRGDGSAVRVFEVRDPAPLLRWLLWFRGEARVLEPRDLDRELAAMAARVARVHQPGGSEEPGLEAGLDLTAQGARRDAPTGSTPNHG